MLNGQDLREYNRMKKQQEREIEKHLVKFRAWERYPGEPYKDFKKRFKSVRIYLGDEEFKY